MILTGYLIIFSILIGWTCLNGLSLPSLNTRIKYKKLPKVSVLIPLRNEEDNVFSLIKSLKALTYKNTEYIFLNDDSTDNTKSYLHQAIDGDNHYRVIEGKPLPENWVGKVHACHQLSEVATGDYLLFLDADVRVHPDTIQRSLMAFKNDTGLVTGFPNYPLKSVLGHLLVPMQHFIVFLHLPILLANKTTWPAATAAHGAYMVFKRSAYDAIDGHRSVKDSLVEDIHITRNIKKRGYKALLVNNTNTVRCYMYNTSKEVWEGFSKNLFPGLGRNPYLVLMLILFYFVFFVMPLPVAIWGVVTANYIWVLPFICSIIIKGLVDVMTHQKKWLCFFIPFSALSMITLLCYSTYLGIFKRGFSWKGRTYQ